MFERYTDIMRDGKYHHPIRITFKNAYIILKGIASVRHIIIGDENGEVDICLNINSCAIGAGMIFATLGSDPLIVKFNPSITKAPSAKLKRMVQEQIVLTSERYNYLHRYWTKKRLNLFFANIYNLAKHGF